MKNKLLLSSALVGGLIASGSSFAQTTVSGNLALSFKATRETCDESIAYKLKKKSVYWIKKNELVIGLCEPFSF